MYNIFQLVDLDSATRKRTLLAFALTCTSFTAMALDLLWQKLEDFSSLLRCLPPSLWTLDDSELRFTRAMTSEDWTIFYKYNHRVRSLDRLSGRRVSPGIWAVISFPPFPLPLLPNLTSLTWCTAFETFSPIRLFLNQNLTTLDIRTSLLEIREFGPCIESVLSSISIICPSVSHFRFCDNVSETLELSIDTSAAILSWSHLSCVRTAMVSDVAILHLANMPSLRELSLELDIDVQSITTDTQAILPHSAFCALRKLSVKCRTFSSSDAFFKKLSIAPKRLSLIILVETDFTQVTVPASMSCISDACAHSALRHLQVTILRTGRSAPSIGSPAFQPFYTFRNLRKFKFHADCKMELDDAMLLQMAKSWPLLEELTIRAGRIEDLQYFTANAFVVLLQHCPRLTSVEMDVDWSDIDQRNMSVELPYEGFAHENLLQADFGSSRIDYPAAVAGFLSSIAPNLERVCAWESDHHFDLEDEDVSGTYSSRWTTVDELLESFSIICKRERRRMVRMGNGREKDA